MNDDELITAVREPFTAVHSATPVEQIVSRSRAIRARRRIPGVAGALAVAAGTALAVTAVLPASHQPSHPGRARWPRGRWSSRPTAVSVSPSTSYGPGRAAAYAPRRWRPGQCHLHRPVEPGMPALRL